MNGTGYKVMTTLSLALAGMVTGLLSLGVYGKLRDKKWGPWSAGAAAGALGGLIGGIGSWIALPRILDMGAPTSGLVIDPMNGLGQIQVTQMPKIVAGLTMSRLSGLQVNGLSMNELPLGAYAVNPRTMQIM
jgi:hypothetical protein